MEKAISAVHVSTHTDSEEEACPLIKTCRMTEATT
jgi:hypothetical protein